MINRNGNIYTIIYALLLAALVAGCLAWLSVSLSPRQKANAAKARNAAICSAARLADASVDSVDVNGLKVYLCISGYDTVRVLPCYGTGLWGPVWGFIALENDMSMVRGVSFDHGNETPGLGGQIADSRFHKRFIGRPLVKGRLFRLDIDGISGATGTSRAVEKMIDDCMTEYAAYIDSLRPADAEVKVETADIEKTEEGSDGQI